MQVVGYDTWEGDLPMDVLIEQALRFSEDVKARGIAQLREAYIAGDEKRLWCTWDTEDIEGLQTAFDAIDAQSGLSSILTPARSFFPWKRDRSRA